MSFMWAIQTLFTFKKILCYPSRFSDLKIFKLRFSRKAHNSPINVMEQKEKKRKVREMKNCLKIA